MDVGRIPYTVLNYRQADDVLITMNSGIQTWWQFLEDGVYYAGLVKEIRALIPHVYEVVDISHFVLLIP